VAERAAGSFEIDLVPVPLRDGQPASAIGLLSIDKRFAGDLTGTSDGFMLASNSPTEGSAAYVAIENVTGALRGRQGSFVLQHTGAMSRGASTLTIVVVPDSGTDELVGLDGSMDIEVVDGRHEYTFDYTLPA
jgi:hypothetical protein